LKIAAYICGLLGLALLVALLVRSDAAAMLHTLHTAGWQLLWLAPYRILFFLLYAIGWQVLLRPYDPAHRVGVGYALWVTTVRESVDRLLPVASVGGGMVGVRLMRWRGIAPAPAAATVIVEVVLTLAALYLFAVLGVLLLSSLRATGATYRDLILALICTLPIPLITGLLLRYGAVFRRLERFLRPLLGEGALAPDAALLDQELHATLARAGTVVLAGMLQLIALLSASLEIWFVLRLFGHPIELRSAVMLESLTQALRHLAFIVPGGIGVQEAAFVLFGQSLGLGSELALAVSMAKRLREVVCGLPALASWQWLEARRLRIAARGTN
jgi:putative membrane protein